MTDRDDFMAEPSVPERSKDLVRRWAAMMSHQAPARWELIAGDAYVEHAVAPFGSTAPGQVRGPAHLHETASWLRAQFPDLEFTLEAVITEGDIVACRVLASGTNLGPFNGVMPPTGKRFEARQTHWFRVENDKLAEHWATREDLPAMLQLGVIHPPGPPHHG
jgi:predicted ester cyclase